MSTVQMTECLYQGRHDHRVKATTLTGPHEGWVEVSVGSFRRYVHPDGWRWFGPGVADHPGGFIVSMVLSLPLYLFLSLLTPLAPAHVSVISGLFAVVLGVILTLQPWVHKPNMESAVREAMEECRRLEEEEDRNASTCQRARDMLIQARGLLDEEQELTQAMDVVERYLARGGREMERP